MRQKDEKKILSIKQRALTMIVEDGLDGLSMQKLAVKANVSPATIYLYFKNREDLILQLAAENNKKMADAMLKGFDPDMHFAEGLRVQWKNRASHSIENPNDIRFLDHILHSPLQKKAFTNMDQTFLEAMSKFVRNAIDRKELIFITPEVYWSVAFSPLYQLVRFHMQGFGLRGEPFSLTDERLDQALELVLKALKP